MILLLACSLALLGYVYAGYPLALRLIVWLRGPRHVRQGDVTASMSLLISAYNEAAVIRKKIENALALDYPPQALEIVVVSDASTDGTDAIVSEYASRGVQLIRQPERRGKTAGLNQTVPRLTGEIVVFSDANAMYERDALRKLARNFADSAVGCVTGEARYLPGGHTVADVGERVYWNYEMQIKRLETALGSMVGGDGAIYAIRRALWRQLPEDSINDLLNPLQIVAAGWRAVYEPDAVCYEETAGGTRTEYRRRVRIVSRSWRAVFQAREVLNPFRVGLFAWSVFSHKVLRWTSGLIAGLALVPLAHVYVNALAQWPLVSIGATVLVIAGAVTTAIGRRGTGMFAYFGVINAASLVGLFKGSTGRVSGVWATAREGPTGTRLGSIAVPVGPVLLIGAALIGWAVSASASEGWYHVAALVFWGSIAALTHVYLAYPLLLGVVRPFVRRPISKADAEPRVCLFIAANDEASVIEAKLLNALALDYPPDRLDIVVASDGSVDETNNIVRRFAPRVRLQAFSPRRGKIAAINNGMASVASEIVIFSDANTFLDTGAVRALVRSFADPQVGAVSGDVALVGDRCALALSEDLYYFYERWVQQAESDIGSMIGADGALYAIRRDLFVPPADDTILDDMAIPMAVVRTGHRVVFEPDARAHEQGSESVREEFARKSRVVAGAMQFIRRRDSAVPLASLQVALSLVSHKALRWLSPAFCAGALVSSLALAQHSSAYAVVAIVQLTLLAMGIAGCARTLRRASPIAVVYYFCLLQAATAVGFIRGLTGRQSVLWQRFARVQAPTVVAYTHD